MHFFESYAGFEVSITKVCALVLSPSNSDGLKSAGDLHIPDLVFRNVVDL